jgi:hypothetical protein
LYVNTDSCPEQIGNYPNARVISNSRGYVKYMEAPGREVDVVVVKKQASRPDCSDSMFARKLHSLGDRVYSQYMKCPFASMCKKCAVYEEHFVNTCKVSCLSLDTHITS